MSISPYTAVQIPCCLCGTMILPNAANQCNACLAQQASLVDLLQRGPGGAPYSTVHQCRECRRHQCKPGSKQYINAPPESPELLALCLQHIPALHNNNSHNNGSAGNSLGLTNKLTLVDANWIWTEPHSMRYKLRLTVRAEIYNVPVQQRVAVELHNKFSPCLDCQAQYKNRTWTALLQVRQKRNDDGPKKGLATLEQMLAKHESIRKHVLRMDTKHDGFDFYFATLAQAQALAQHLSRIVPVRISTSPKMVSEDVHNNVANMKYSVACDLVPLCRHDLIVLDKSIPKSFKFTGRLGLVLSVGKLIHVIDASMSTNDSNNSSSRSTGNDKKDASYFQMSINPENYYKYEKQITVWQSSPRLVPFVVLDVEMIQGFDASTNDGDGKADDSSSTDGTSVLSGSTAISSMYSKYTLSEVQVMRQSDLGVSSSPTIYHCVTHIGHLLSSGDVVYGYDVATALTSSNTDWQRGLQNHYQMPDVVLVYKDNSYGKQTQNKHGTEANGDLDSQNGPRKVSKKKERRIKRKLGKKARELEDAAVRMGFLQEEVEDDEDDDDGGNKKTDIIENGSSHSRSKGRFDDNEQTFVDAGMETDIQALEKEFNEFILPDTTITEN